MNLKIFPSLALLVATSFAQPNSQEDFTSKAADQLAQATYWEETVPLELRALGEISGVSLALVDVAGEPTLVTSQSGLLSLRLGNLDPAAHRLTFLTRSGKERTITLDHPATFIFPAVDPEPFLTPGATAARRGSRPSAPPRELVLSWPKLDREAKESILLDALKNGTVLQVHVEASGGISTTTGFLFAPLEANRNRERKDRFIASLTTDQRAEFDASIVAAIRITAPPTEIEAQKAAGKKASARRGKFLASLTPDQNALYHAWMDPIQPASPGQRSVP